MSMIIKKSLNQPDETQTPEMQKIETVTVNGMKIHRVTAEPGWQWSKHIKPIVGGESCQKHHIVYIISGKLHAKMDDGKEEVFGPGEVGDISPGHDGWNDGSGQVVWLEIVR